VDFEAGTIKITETERHRPKNRFSFRAATRRIGPKRTWRSASRFS